MTALMPGRLLRPTRALWSTWRAAWQEAWSNRRGFWVQVSIMLVNDLVWIAFWILFFRRVEDLNGWRLDRIIVLFSVLAMAAGIVLGLLHNCRRIGQLAATGGLDAALTLPAPTLLYLLCRKVEPVNTGDVLFGLLLFTLFGDPSPRGVAVFVFCVLCAVLVAVGFLVLIGSSSFLVGRNDGSDLGFHALFLFSSYPIDLFGGPVRLLLYLVVPAGFVTAVPVRLIERFEWQWAGLALVAAVAFFAAGWAAFTLGLRRYTSGAVWTSA